MQRFHEEARAFGARQLAAVAEARQLAAMQLVCGIDLSAALEAGSDVQKRLIRRIERLIERERLKGMRRHWSYDLNRHIALKQVLDRLRETQPGQDRAHTARKTEKRAARHKPKRRPKAPCTMTNSG